MTMWRRFMPDWLVWMRECHPEFALHMEADYSERPVDCISQSALDLAIAHMPSGLPGRIAEPSMEDELIMVSRTARDFASCDPAEYVFVDGSYGYREEHQEKLPEFATSTINAGYGEIALDYLYASSCYSCMPRAHVVDDLAKKQLHIVKDAPCP